MRRRAAGTGGARGALLGSAALHAALLLAVFGAAVVAEPSSPSPAEVRASVTEPAPLPAPPPRPEPEPPPAPPEASPPEVLDPLPPEETALEEHAPSPLPLLRDAIAVFAPSSLRPGARIHPAPRRELPPTPSRPLAVPVAAPRPAGPTTGARPEPGNPAPRYPPRAVSEGWEGVVLLLVSVLADGTVAEVLVRRSSGRPALDREAMRAVSRWRFAPALRDGVAVPARVEVPIRFELR